MNLKNLQPRAGNISPVQAAFFGSLLLSFVATLSNPVINRDGILYVETARIFLVDGFLAAYQLYNWPFLPVLMAIVSKVTGIGLENSGLLLNALFLAGSCALLVSIVQKRHSEACWQVFLVVLAVPGLNDYRNELIREYGCWFFSVLSFWLAGRWSENPGWRSAIGVQAALCIAALFRPEALVFLVALIFWQLFEAPVGEKVRRIVMIASLSLCGLAVLVFLLLNEQLPVRLSSELGRLSLARFNEKAEVISSHLLPYAKEQTKTILLMGSLSIIPLKFIGQLGVFIIPLLFSLKNNKLRSLSGSSSLFAWGFLAHLMVLAAFVVEMQFLAGRYVSVLCLLAAPSIGFGLWQLMQCFPRWKTSVSLFAVVLMMNNVISISPGKDYMIDAGKWLALTASSPANSPVYVDSSRVAYYAGWRYADVSERADRMKMMGDFKSGKFDLVVLEVSSRDGDVDAWLNECGLRVIKRFHGQRKEAVVIAERMLGP